MQHKALQNVDAATASAGTKSWKFIGLGGLLDTAETLFDASHPIRASEIVTLHPRMEVARLIIPFIEEIWVASRNSPWRTVSFASQ